MVLQPSTRASSVASFKVMDVLEQANQLSAQGHKVLHCEVGQPETGAPKLVSQAAAEALQGRQVMGYTDAFGLLPLRQEIAQHYKKKYNNNSNNKNDDDAKHVTVDPSRIVVTTGSSGGFLLAFTACFDSGDVVAIASAGYPCYRNILSALDVELAHMNVNHEFKLTRHELEAHVDQRKSKNQKPIRGLILSSPSNPTGAMLTPQELKDLCEYCDANDIQFLSDEIYHGISYGKQEATALQYTNNAIIINSFSKYYSMSGWRLGWMVLPPHLVSTINSLQQNMFINAPTISQTAALQCWKDVTLQELEGHVTKYRSSRKIILDALAKLPGLQIAPADGGFYVYVDLRGSDNNSSSDNGTKRSSPQPLIALPELGTVAMCQALLQEHHVAFTPGIDFEDPLTDLGNCRFRISYAGGIDTATESMERFLKFWPSWLERVQSTLSSNKKSKES